MAVDHNVLADIIMQRMARHAPVTQNCHVNPGSDASGRWLVTWGHRSMEGQSRYEAVMGIMFSLLDEANPVDPRLELPDEDQAQTDDGNGEA